VRSEEKIAKIGRREVKKTEIMRRGSKKVPLN
jgi:hypothetical protein